MNVRAEDAPYVGASEAASMAGSADKRRWLDDLEGAGVVASFKPLHRRLKKMMGRYNPDHRNLEMDPLTQVDDELYPAFLDLAEAGWRAVRNHRCFLLRHSLYADEMFWYRLFTAIRAAGDRVLEDPSMIRVRSQVIDRLLLVMSRITRYSAHNGGDITKRNAEALATTLLAFFTEERLSRARAFGSHANEDVGRVMDWVVQAVVEGRNEMGLFANASITRST